MERALAALDQEQGLLGLASAAPGWVQSVLERALVVPSWATAAPW